MTTQKRSTDKDRYDKQIEHSESQGQDSSGVVPFMLGKIRKRDGTVINIGERVAFLATGLYPLQSGVVHHVTRLWVTSINDSGISIKRSPSNVRIVQRVQDE